MQFTPDMYFVFAYFLFLFALLVAVNNGSQVANYAEKFVQEKSYNLRDLPRVDYKEVTSEEEDDDEDDDEMSVSSEEIEQTTLFHRRERNPIGRILETSD